MRALFYFPSSFSLFAITVSFLYSSSLFCGATAPIQEGDQMDYLLKAKIQWEEPHKEISFSTPLQLRVLQSKEDALLFSMHPKKVSYQYFFKDTLIHYRDGENGTIRLVPQVRYLPVEDQADLDGTEGKLMISASEKSSYIQAQEIVTALLDRSERPIAQYESQTLRAIENELAPLLYLSFSLYTGRIQPSEKNEEQILYRDAGEGNRLYISQNIHRPLQLHSRCHFTFDEDSQTPSYAISLEFTPLIENPEKEPNN